MEKKMRILMAKPGLDGHDVGAKVVARALRDAGMEIIYTGLHQTPQQIVSSAIQEDVDVIGLSILSGAHLGLVERIVNILSEKGGADIKVVVGGVIPEEDREVLKHLGVAAVFTSEICLDDIVKAIRNLGDNEK
jgi:methylmalonyl-CoA mutase C-terminal domain/subunit